MPRKKLDTPVKRLHASIERLWDAIKGKDRAPVEELCAHLWPTARVDKKKWTLYKWKEGESQPSGAELYALDEYAEKNGITQFYALRKACGAAFQANESLTDEALDAGELSGLICTLAKKPLADVTDGELEQAEHMAERLLRKIQGERRARRDGAALLTIRGIEPEPVTSAFGDGAPVRR